MFDAKNRFFDEKWIWFMKNRLVCWTNRFSDFKKWLSWKNRFFMKSRVFMKNFFGMKKTFFDKKSNVHHNIDFFIEKTSSFVYEESIFCENIDFLWKQLGNCIILLETGRFCQTCDSSSKKQLHLPKTGLICKKMD